MEPPAEGLGYDGTLWMKGTLWFRKNSAGLSLAPFCPGAWEAPWSSPGPKGPVLSLPCLAFPLPALKGGVVLGTVAGRRGGFRPGKGQCFAWICATLGGFCCCLVSQSVGIGSFAPSCPLSRECAGRRLRLSFLMKFSALAQNLLVSHGFGFWVQEQNPLAEGGVLSRGFPSCSFLSSPWSALPFCPAHAAVSAKGERGRRRSGGLGGGEKIPFCVGREGAAPLFPPRQGEGGRQDAGGVRGESGRRGEAFPQRRPAWLLRLSLCACGIHIPPVSPGGEAGGKRLVSLQSSASSGTQRVSSPLGATPAAYSFMAICSPSSSA